MRKTWNIVPWSVVAAAAVVCSAAPAATQTYEFNLEAQDLDTALQQVAHISGKEVMYAADVVSGKRAPGLHGSLTVEEAIKTLLNGTDLIPTFRADAVLIHPSATSSREAVSKDVAPQEIVVTGSHIRGSESTSHVTVSSREEIEQRGLADLGSFARDLVQNYSGGQNPGIGGGGQGGSENVTSSSTLNLRGLGQDATLTLLDGHRISYDAEGQGVDISTIPLAAVERVEVVTDGSSALYGSDAVGGVANVILRRDFQGAEASARVGAATDGGDVEQQYNIVTGDRWASGGFMAAFDYRHSTPITAGERSYMRYLDAGATLVAGQSQYSAIVAGHQDLTDALTFAIDGNFSRRTTRLCVVSDNTEPCTTYGDTITPVTRAWSISPSLRLKLPGDWEARLGGTLSESKTNQSGDFYYEGAITQSLRNLYTNRLNSLELSADGTLFDLPGGPAKLAVGVGVRDAKFKINEATLTDGAYVTSETFSVNQDTHYAYGELSLPIVGPDNAVPFVERFTLTGAVRYEDVSHVGRLATPKFGAIYAPSPDIAFKFNWGKSFKAPTLYQIGEPKLGYSQVGSTAFLPPSPVPGTVLSLYGGNPDLKPERATSWTATITLTPRAIDGLHVDVSYFRIKYRDRVVAPVPGNSTAFQPIYSAYVTLNPTRAQVLAAIAGLPTVYDLGGGDLSTANVVAIVNNVLQNAARQSIQGVDIAADYDFRLTERDKVSIKAGASYLKSEQQLSSSQPIVQMAGIIYHPPHWRAQSSVDWERGNFSLLGAFTFIGGTLDNRLEPYPRVGSFKSVDTVARLKTSDPHGLFAQTSFTLSALNIFNEKPSYIRTLGSGAYSYDSTNYPSVGRFVSLTITKAF